MRTLLVALVGAALLAVGIALLGTGSGDTDFGWFAYTPLEDGEAHVFDGVLLISTGRLVAGTVCAGLGLVTVAGLVGFRIGRRARPGS